MRNTKGIIALSVLVVAALVVRLFCGVFVHDEFGYDVYFIKYRPTWKWRFFSPRGESDTQLHELTLDKQYEQKMFNEFVGNRIKR